MFSCDGRDGSDDADDDNDDDSFTPIFRVTLCFKIRWVHEMVVMMLTVLN
jgi:hypothetical protein